jgi:hypothetical protein
MKTLYLFVAGYLTLLLVAVFLLPLRLGEILQAAGVLHFSFGHFFERVAETPAAVPLANLVQLPFALLAPSSRLALRLPSLLFALGSCWLFFKLAKQASLDRPYLALLVFLALPVHYQSATQGRPYEQGLFLLLLSTLFFFRLIDAPSVRLAVSYAALLTACIFTEPACYLPAVGYMLFLLRFVISKAIRRALWFTLPATVLPALLFAPYYAWSRPHADPAWLTEQLTVYSWPFPVQVLESVAPGDWSIAAAIGLFVLLLIGFLAGALSTFRMTTAPIRRRILLFCLAGGAFVQVLSLLFVESWNNAPFTPSDILWATPSLVLLVFAAIQWLAKVPLLRSAFIGPILAALLVALCVPADLEYLATRQDDLRDLTALIQPQLAGGDACVIFTSEKQSRYLFLLFQPELERSECQNFFHRRIVLAIHPFVKPEEQREVEQYFRGLSFVEINRVKAAGGEVITLRPGR